MLQVNRKWVQRNMTTIPANLGEADANLTALVPGIRPDLFLKKQIDQVGVLNDKLSPAGLSSGSSAHYRQGPSGSAVDNPPGCRPPWFTPYSL
jgi:hypothetical protein